MIISSILLAAAMACPSEAKLNAMLPEVFAKCAAHYRALDAAATPLMNTGNPKALAISPLPMPHSR